MPVSFLCIGTLFSVSIFKFHRLIKQISISSFRDIAEDEVDHLFAAADDDNDDLLSFLEILDHHDVFVGSEATDYGDHLHNLDRFDDEL